MTPDRQKLIEQVFIEATERPDAERAEYLRRRCGADQDLRREVESLLGAHEGGVGMLDEPQPMTIGLMQQLSGLLRVDDAAIPPSGKIGGYRVHRVLGSGGMGVVYLAEQERPKRTVALKVIRRGLATSSLLRRFEHEAEILGRLHHPGIAQIYEAGVADDGHGPQPYIAMEYINGRPLTEYAAVQKLGVREKLALMVKVCEAVQHAHQRGVIHRDLKPGNILVQEVEGASTADGGSASTSIGAAPGAGSAVAGVGQPKILDFGVARLAEKPADATTMGTNVGQLIGTLAYMSPEQLGADARDLDTRSDVYALGVVLFQLLSGKLPFQISGHALPEAVRMIKEDPPTRLTTVSREYRGDLETIVNKAIDKEKGRRYQSAAELGADLQRYLRNEPIAAKRDSALYVLRKQMVRYKSAVGVAAVGVMLLVAFTVYAAVSAERSKALAFSEKAAHLSAQVEKDRADAALRRLQDELFVSNIERGRLEGAMGKVVVAEDLLWTEYFRDPDSPHARWALWELYSRFPCRWTVQGTDDTRCMSLSSDRTMVATGASDKSISIHSAETGSLIRRLPPLAGAVLGVALDPGGQHVLAGLANGQVCVLRTDSLSEPPLFLQDAARPIRGYIKTVAWSPDGRWLAASGWDRRIRIWDSQAPTAPVADWEAHARVVSCLAFSPDSMMLASGSAETGPEARVRLWTIPDGRPAGDFEPRESFVTGVAFSPDGGLLATITLDRFAMIHSLATRESRLLPGKFTGAGSSIEFSPDGTRVVGAGGSELRAWSVNDGTALLTLGQHYATIVDAHWVSPERIVSTSYDGAIKLWDARGSVGLDTVGGFTSWCFGTAYSPDGKLLAIGSGDGTIVIADADTQERIHVIPTGAGLRTRPVRFLPDGDQLIAGCADGLLRIIDVKKGVETARFGTPRQEIYAIALHPNGRLIATAHEDLTVRLWDLESHEKIRELKDPRMVNRIEGVAFSPDGRYLATGGPSKGVLLWNTDTWSTPALLPGAAQVWPLAFSPDGKLLAAGTWGDQVQLWEMATRLEVGSLTGHRGLISTIAFSPDGAYIASGGDDATVKLWHVKSRRCVLSLDTNHGEATGLSFHPSGARITTGCQDRASLTWDLTALDPYIAGNTEYHRARLKLSAADLTPPPSAAPGH